MRPALASVLLALSVAAAAQETSSRRIGDVVVHYAAVRADSVDRAVASRHGLVASGERGLLQATLRRDGSDAPVAADVGATIEGPDGVPRTLKLRELPGEGTHVAQFPLREGGAWRFELVVQWRDGRPPTRIRFVQALVPG